MTGYRDAITLVAPGGTLEVDAYASRSIVIGGSTDAEDFIGAGAWRVSFEVPWIPETFDRQWAIVDRGQGGLVWQVDLVEPGPGRATTIHCSRESDTVATPLTITYGADDVVLGYTA